MRLPFLSFSTAGLQRGLAGCCLTAALICLWAGSSSSRIASASTGTFALEPLPDAQRLGLHMRLLQATVDSAAFSLAGMLEHLPDEGARRAALADALDSLTFDLGAPAYFTAWDATRLLHSPLTPDAADCDFRDALDGRGVPFVQSLSAVPEGGGGFLQVRLPRRTVDSRPPYRVSGPAVVVPGTLAPAFPAFVSHPLPQGEDTRLIYTRRIPGSTWRISAFTGLSAAAPLLWENSVLEPAAAWRVEEEALPFGGLQTGLYVSGLSFLGLSGALLFPRRPCAKKVLF